MCSIRRRLRLEKDGDGPCYSDKEAGYFSVKLHHGGWINIDSNKEYVNGKVNFFDYCDVDLVSLLEFEDMLEELGRGGRFDCYCKTEHGTFKKLEQDNDVITAVLKYVGEGIRTIDFYCSHIYVPHEGESQRWPSIDVSCSSETFQNAVSNFQPLDPFERPVENEEHLDGCDNVQGDDEQGGSEDDGSEEDGSELEEFEESDYEVEEEMIDIGEDEWTRVGLGIEGDDMEAENVNSESDEGQYSLSSSSSDSDGVVGKKKKKKRTHFPAFNKRHMEDPHFEIGQLFSSSNQLRQAIRHHAIKEGREIKIPVSSTKRVRAKCREGCKWSLFASSMQGESTLQIKTHCPIHSCSRSLINHNVRAKWLAKQYLDRIRSNPQIPVQSLVEQISVEHRVTVSFHKAYRAKKIAFEMLFGSLKDQYSRLYDYGAEIMRSNPDSTVRIQNEDGQFKRMYICFGALKKGFLQHCRPLIGMDGAHLKGIAKGILLTAVGVDGNNALYPLAYAVVESENKNSWMWFIELVKEDIGFTNSHHWCWISDKQKGLIEAFKELCPNSEHRFCVRHLYNNFKTVHKGLDLKDQLYACARATTVEEFGEKMEEFKVIDPVAAAWFDDKPPEQWSKSHFQTFPKSDMLLNNLCESFNSLILDARDKPIITMLERIRVKLMKRIALNRSKMMKTDSILCPKIHEILEKIKTASTYCVPEWSGTPKFEVNGPGGKFVCDLDAGTCACRKWDLTGIPCKHAVAAINYFAMEPETFVSKLYHRESYMSCYSNCIQPLNGPLLWPKQSVVPLTPPLYKPLKGRAHKGARKPEEGEKTDKTAADPFKLGKKHQQSLKCTNCGEKGHNKRSCKLPPKEAATVKKSRGRPKEKRDAAAEASEPPKKKRKYTKSTKPKVKPTFKAQVSVEASQGNDANEGSQVCVPSQETVGNLATQGSQSTTTQTSPFKMRAITFHGQKVYFRSEIQTKKSQVTPPSQ